MTRSLAQQTSAKMLLGNLPAGPVDAHVAQKPHSINHSCRDEQEVPAEHDKEPEAADDEEQRQNVTG